MIVTGLSGAGKSQAVNCLEDLGYYCVDNMPPRLMTEFVSLAGSSGAEIDKAAFVVDIRGGLFFEDLLTSLEELEKAGVSYRIMYLEASDQTLLRRYKETRRIHPMSNGGSIAEGIAREKEKLGDIKKKASFVIDTTGLKTAGLNKQIKSLLQSDENDSFTMEIMSFGYKNGIPAEADFVFDTRFLPNPFYVASLKKLTGNNKKVREYVMRSKLSHRFLHTVAGMLESTIPAFINEGKYHLVVAFGCTGGQHRSVTMANELSDILKENGRNISTTHRDIK
ncbi:MAG: RNase adapter RapZ [Firmicutes bacterium]|nr:RNase adapter RapZ [Bacillota bacterium]